jgi:hypothetical protein
MVDDPERPDAAGSSIRVTQTSAQRERKIANARANVTQTSEVQSPRSGFVQPYAAAPMRVVNREVSVERFVWFVFE